MTGPLFELLERLHGHLGWLGLAALLHPIVSLRKRGVLTRGGRIALGLAVALLVAPFASGWALYPSYREHVKPRLGQEHEAIMWAFESKEHLALLCVVLAIGGAGLLFMAPKDERSRELGWSMLVLSWLAGAVVGGIGVVVAAHSTWG